MTVRKDEVTFLQQWTNIAWSGKRLFHQEAVSMWLKYGYQINVRQPCGISIEFIPNCAMRKVMTSHKTHFIRIIYNKCDNSRLGTRMVKSNLQ